MGWDPDVDGRAEASAALERIEALRVALDALFVEVGDRYPPAGPLDEDGPVGRRVARQRAALLLARAALRAAFKLSVGERNLREGTDPSDHLL